MRFQCAGLKRDGLTFIDDFHIPYLVAHIATADDFTMAPIAKFGKNMRTFGLVLDWGHFFDEVVKKCVFNDFKIFLLQFFAEHDFASS